jgi:hypothetical protein
MRCLYQKDERALPGNLLNRIYSFFLTLNVVSFPTLPLLSLSLSLSVSQLVATAGVQLKIKRLVVGLKGLDAKTN